MSSVSVSSWRDGRDWALGVLLLVLYYVQPFRER